MCEIPGINHIAFIKNVDDARAFIGKKRFVNTKVIFENKFSTS